MVRKKSENSLQAGRCIIQRDNKSSFPCSEIRPHGTPKALDHLVVPWRGKLLKFLLQAPSHKFVKLIHCQGCQRGQVVNSLRHYLSPCLGVSCELDFHRYGKAVTADEKQVERSCPFRKVQLTGDKRNTCRIFLVGVIVILKKFRVFLQQQL